MNNNEAILEQARTYLTSGWSAVKSTGQAGSWGNPEVVYDHSLRVLKLSKLLTQDHAIPEPKIDYQVLSASSLFHDAGWVELVKTGQIHPAEVYARPSDAGLYKRSVQIVCEQIGNLLSERTLEKVVQTLSELKSVRPGLSESRLVADADNLEDFGLTGITFQVRAAQSTGKSITQLLESWQRQQEYHYWEARIKNALFLETSKKIAQRRLETIGQTFDLLRREVAFEDFDLNHLQRTPHFVAG